MLKILIVDDHPVVRRGLTDTLTEGFDEVTVGEASSAQEALELIWKEDWGVVLLDISMPGRSGLELIKDIKQARPKLPVLVLSMHSEEQFAVRVMKNGAAGYLTKETAPQELVTAVKRVLDGGKYIRASVAERLATHLETNSDQAPHEQLSDREYQVLCMIAGGRTVKEIAGELSLSIKTISTYRTRILEKMKMANNAEIMSYAIQNGLVNL